MSKDSHSTSAGVPPKPSLTQSGNHANQDGDDESVSSLRIRKRDRIINFFRSSTPEPKVGSHTSSTGTKTVEPRLNAFRQNVDRPIVRVVLPDVGTRIDNTPQLAMCLGLLPKGHNIDDHRKVLLQGDSIDAGSVTWIKALEQEPIERHHIHWLGVRMVEVFIGDTLKDSVKIAEVVLIGAVLEREHYRKLLSCFVNEFDGARILDIEILQGLVQLVQAASPGFLNADDLIKILSIIRTRLQGTHQQSADYPFHLTLAVSRILDVMTDHKVQDLNRVEEHEPLSGVLSGLRDSSDPFLMYQACYAFQALQYVPDDEIPLQTVLRHSAGMADGVLKVSGLVKLDLGGLLEGLKETQKMVEETVDTVKAAVEGALSLIESGRGVFDSLKEGLWSGQKRLWYPAIRGAYALAQVGQLKDLNELIYKAPCRRDPLFQWGICQLLGEIASDSIWDATVRKQSVDLLGALYRNDTDWGQDESVKSCTLNIICQLRADSDHTVSASASSLLKDLKQDQGTISKTRYPLRNRLPIPTSSPVLFNVQKIPYLEYDLYKLRLQRLEETRLPIYIPPMAKANLQAADDDLFPLMENVQEFLEGERQVMLILGDSGAGKSTFNKHLESELLRSYKTGNAIPLFINLPAIDQPNKDMIEKQLEIHKFSPDQINELRQHHRFILICDGYDESQQLVNLHRTNMLNQRGQWNTKMIVSCRSQYLGQDYRNRFMPQGIGHYDSPGAHLFQEAIIAPFSRDQIKSYVEQYVPLEPRTWTTQDYMDKLSTIPNLLDLVKNPFLLTLALEALPNVTDGKENLSAIRITRVQLYDVFVEHWLEVNMRRLESNTLSAQERISLDQLVDAGFVLMGTQFSSRLASAIFDKQDGNPVVKYVHIHDKGTWREEFFGPDTEVRLLRESSPLSRTGSMFRFLHKSILEYFFSRAIFDPSRFPSSSSLDSAAVKALDTEGPLFKRNLLSEPSVIQFLSERAQQRSDFKAQLLGVIEQSKTSAAAATAASNAITILIRAGVHFNGADLRDVRISGADLSCGQFDSAQFQGADLRGVNLARTWLRQANLSNALMQDVQFGELPFLREDSGVCCCAYSPDGKMLTLCLSEGQISTYDTATWKRRYTRKEHSGSVNGIAFSPDSQRFVSGGDDSTVRMWDSSRGEVLFVIIWSHRRRRSYGEMLPLQVHAVAFSPCGKQFAAAGEKLHVGQDSDDVTGEPYDGEDSDDDTVEPYDGDAVQLWNSDTAESLFVLKGLDDDGICVQYSPNGRQIVAGCLDGNIQMWDSETGDPGASWNTSYGPVVCCAFSPNGLLIASGHPNGMIQLWTASSGIASFALVGHGSIATVTGVAFSPNSLRLASSCFDETVRLWDVSTGTLISVFNNVGEAVLDVSFSPDDRHIASGHASGVVRLWEAGSSVPSTGIRPIAEPISFVAYSSNGHSLISTDHRNTILHLDPRTGEVGPNLVRTMSLGLVVALSPDDRQIAFGDDFGGDIYLWNCQTGAAEGNLSSPGSSVAVMTFSPCGRYFAFINSRHIVRLCDRHVPGLETFLADDKEGYHSTTYTLSFSSTGHELAVGFALAAVGLYDTRTRSLLRTITLSYEKTSWQLGFSPSDQLLGVFSLERSIVVWDILAEKQIAGVAGTDGQLQTIVFSMCGSWMASASANKRVRLWRRQDSDDLESWVHVTEVCGFISGVRIVAWNPVAPMEFATCCFDGSVQVWHIVTGEDGSVSVGLVWTTDLNQLIISRVAFKDAIGLDPVYQKLLAQGSTLDELGVDEGD
jgi:WD40 repeat protein